MKKVICVFLVVFSLLAGCQKKVETPVRRVVLLSLEEKNSGLALFYDEDFNLLYEKETVFPYRHYYDDTMVYLSDDGKNYVSIEYQSGKEGEKRTNIRHDIAILYRDSYFADTNGGFCKFETDGSEVCVEGFISCYSYDDQYVYLINNSNTLIVCDIERFQEVNRIQLENSEFLAFTQIDGKTYIANDYGLTLLQEGQIQNTYVYPNDFQELKNINGRMIFFEEKQESVVYLISFDRYRMILTPYYNEEYYRKIDFDVEFKDYFEAGYQIVDFHELSY